MPSLLDSLDPLVTILRERGHRVVAPTLRDGAIVLAEIGGADELPHGWGVRTAPGRYEVYERSDGAAFAHSTGPQSWKSLLHPARDQLLTADTADDGSGEVTFTPAPVDAAPVAFLGVRPCDLRAIGVQDRVLGIGSRYAARRAQAIIIAVNCTEPSSTCFCVSAGGGPRAERDFDLVLTELTGTASPRYLVEAGSDVGARLLIDLPTQRADSATQARGESLVADAAARMGRSLPSVDLRDLLATTLNAARWDDVAARCLACGNCTMACPTCFCTSVEEVTDLTGQHAQRWQHWASCFETDFSYLHGGPVRETIHSRYRQWLTHKLGTWHDQFGESGCVGCGRCIAWCPVGIDITVETHALAQEAGLGASSTHDALT